MIFGKYEIFDVTGFARGLERAARGLLRVAIESEAGPGSTATGWLITDDLVVICDYVLTKTPADSQGQYYCYLSQEQDEPPHRVAADPLPNWPDSSDGSGPALLRLREPLPERALILRPESLVKDDQVLLLHFAQGRSRVQLSMGRLVSKKDPWLHYDAGTEGGSGGGPIFSPVDWRVSGMHVKASRNAGFNEGLSLSAILELLRTSEAWDEIARYHNLADVTRSQTSLEQPSKAKPATQEKALLAAAVRWSFNPKTFRTAEREQLGALVVDPNAKLWTMRASERQTILRSAASLEELIKARGRKRSRDTGQRVIDKILKGPPYNLDKVDEAALPYWLQAVRWFADVIPSLPTPKDVNRSLEQKRMRSRLQAIAGPQFRGRIEQLAILKAWYKNLQGGPMVITGIGGVGKSSLVARFIELLPATPLLLWLDFDRADLAPDDAVSVLTLLSEQLSLQLDNFVPTQVVASSWQETAKQVGVALAVNPPPLLVLDGFEVAQHAKQHNEIWQVLKLILESAPDLRIIVSGRAPVANLDLDRRVTEKIHLTGMSPEDASGLLRERGIKDEDVLARVVDISEGVPLVLLLALRLIKDGGQIADLPENLPKALVKGFLYDRILDRVIDPVLKPVAQDALVLRYLTPLMIAEVMSDRLPNGLSAADVFSRLSFEMGLVGDEGDPRALSVLLPGRSEVLHLRPEVRAASLKLLERDNPERVATIDGRAIDWYAKQDLTDAANAAELVYHNLRLGKLKAAEDAWINGCGILLRYADEDLPDAAAAERAWLCERTRDAEEPSLEGWEMEAAERIRESLGRGLSRVVPGILKEHEERSANSPLAPYDAWMCWQDGDLTGARKRLGSVDEMEYPGHRDRVLLAALFSARAGEPAKADTFLSYLDDERQWFDRPDAVKERLAVQASRIRLAVDLEKEFAVSEMVKDSANLQQLSAVKEFLTSSDIVLPELCRQIDDTGSYEDVSMPVPSSSSELVRLRMKLESERSASRSAKLLPGLDATPNPNGPWVADDIGEFRAEIHRPSEIILAQDLAVLGVRRWQIALNSYFIAQACELAVGSREPADALDLAIAGTIAAFRGYQLSFRSPKRFFQNLDELLFGSIKRGAANIMPHAPSPDRAELAKAIFARFEGESMALGSELIEPTVEQKFLITGGVEREGYRFLERQFERREVVLEVTPLPDGSVQVIAEGSESKVAALKKQLETNSAFPAVHQVEETKTVRYLPRELFKKVQDPELFSVLFYLLGPDPLEVLCLRLLGIENQIL